MGLQSRYLSLMNLEEEAEICLLAYHEQRKSFLVFKINNKILQYDKLVVIVEHNSSLIKDQLGEFTQTCIPLVL